MNLLDLYVRITAKDEASDEIERVSGGITEKLGGAAKFAAGALTAATAAAGAAVVAVGKQAFDSYAEFEQLEGGVQKLFGNSGKTIEEYAQAAGKSVAEIRDEYQRNEEAQNKMMSNAQNAFANMGLSANDYMSQATSFSAALISSLGGDTSKAADMANTAMASMADNVSIFGSNVEDVQNAYQGFAKQNYTMLDNLKLGYGGTKEEMQRLIDDANAYAASIGEANDLSIDSFADVVKAIDLVQQKQGIAGNAATEASKTLEGSINSVKAAWSNLLTELGKDDGDIGARIQELSDSAGHVIDNVIPVIQNIGEGLAQALPTLIPKLLELGGQIITTIGQALVTSVPLILESLGQTVTQIYESMSGLFGQVDWSGLLTDSMFKASEIATKIVEKVPEVINGLMQMLTGIVSWIGDNADTVIETVSQVAQTVASTLIENLPSFLENLGTLIGAIAAAILENMPVILEAIFEVMFNIVSGLIEHFPEILMAIVELLGNIVTAIVEKAPEIAENFGHLLGTMIGKVAEFGAQMLQAGLDFIGSFFKGNEDGKVPIVEFFTHLPENLLNALGAIGTFLLDTGKAFLNGLFSGVKDAFPGMEEFFRTLPQKLLDTMGAIGTFLLNAGKSLLDGFFNGVKEIGDNVTKWFSDLPQNILNALGDLGNLLFGAGQDIINGFWDGLENAFSGVQNWVSGIGDWIADNKGPKQYDLGLLVPNGKWIMEGLANGMRKGMSMVQDVVGDIAPSISANVTPATPQAVQAQSGGPSVNIYMTYNAGEDATELVSDMATQLALYGYSLGEFAKA